jgi:nucleoside-diphosphate-sugar epimerase
VLSGKTFMVTGSTGQLGSRTVSRLEELGASVIPLVLEGYADRPKREAWTARTMPYIARDGTDLDGLPDPDHVINYHLRMESGLPSTADLLFQIDYNLHRPSFLWDWLAGRELRSFVNISSIKVFSSLNPNPISAETEPMPSSPYGIAKLAAEKFFDSRFTGKAGAVAHLRICSVTSASEHPSKMMSRLCASAFENTRIRLNAVHHTHLVYIDDMVDMIINSSLTADRSRYIVTPERMGIGSIARRFEEISGKRLNVEYIDLAPNMTDPVFISDMHRLQADWTRRTSLDAMIEKVIGQRYGNGDAFAEPRSHQDSS